MSSLEMLIRFSASLFFIELFVFDIESYELFAYFWRLSSSFKKQTCFFLVNLKTVHSKWDFIVNDLKTFKRRHSYRGGIALMTLLLNNARIIPFE